MATIRLLGLPDPGRCLKVQPHRHFVIGRDHGCDLVITSAAVSRFHAQVIFSQGNFFLEDLGSTNGTFRNGIRLRQREKLQDNDRIVIHETPITFYEADVSEKQMTEPIELTQGVELQSFVHSLGESAGVLTLKSRLDSLIEIARDLGSYLKLDEILPRVLDVLFRMFPQAIVGEIQLLNAQGLLLPVAMKHGRNAQSTDLTGEPYCLQLAQQVLETGAGVVVTENSQFEDLALEEFAESNVCVPIPGRDSKPCGIIFLSSELSTSGFTDEDLELVGVVGVLAGQSIAYSKSHELLVSHTNTQRQLETARHVQLSTLPRQRPQHSDYVFHDHYSAAESVGGDHYFYETLGDGRIMFGIADASGKGLPAAMSIMRFGGEVRYQIATSPTLKSALSRLNQFVLESSEDCMFITACICVLDPRNHRLSLANAGHPSPLLVRHATRSVQTLNPRTCCFPLGIDTSFEVHPLNIDLLPGDQIVFFTDGISEAANKRNELFGLGKLSESLCKSPHSIKGLVDRLIRDVNHFRDGRTPSDDTTVLGLERLFNYEVSQSAKLAQ